MVPSKYAPVAHEVCPGVWRIALGDPETFTPHSVLEPSPSLQGLAFLPDVAECPINIGSISAEATPRGFLVSIPLDLNEQIYGLGLQLLSFNQRGKKKTLRVNSDPVADTGDSHAPVPFFATTGGYGILVDTLRYMTIYCGGAERRAEQAPTSESNETAVSGSEELYASRAATGASEILIEIPRARGVDLYVFAGPSLRNAVQRYNLYSGGGCVPPRWGLGVWYRCKSDYDHEAVLGRAEAFRESRIPCDVIGLEPGWQTKTYSNSHVWSSRFPDPASTASLLAQKGFKLNLWTHAFTHPTSPLFSQLEDSAGNYLVWGGLVPDFACAETRRRFAGFFDAAHVSKGVSGYKLDECDNSDYIGSPWSFPEFSVFPSGLDGEQMHSAFGGLFQKTVQSIYESRNLRTYGEVRSSHAFSAPNPFVFYSDLYDHTSFIRGVATAGFCGLLWSPEVRHAESAEDLIRRIQSTVFSPQAVVNAWYIKNAPWDQWLTEQNNSDILQADRDWVVEVVRKTLQLRMRLLPYLYAAFVDYWKTGVPPFRAIAMDHPDDANTWSRGLEYMMGDRILVAPVVAGQLHRDVYLPSGAWRDFWTNERHEGGQRLSFAAPIDRIPLFVKDGCLLPLAGDAQHAEDPALWELTVNVYGSGQQGIVLYEDDGNTLAYRDGLQNRVDLQWNGKEAAIDRSGRYDGAQFRVSKVAVLP